MRTGMNASCSIRGAVLVAIAFALSVGSGCTVRPLLATQPGNAGQETGVSLSSVAVSPVNTRYAQEVRNHLIFLLRGGAKEPAAPRYNVDLSVSRSVASAAQVQRGNDNEPSAGTVTLAASYRLTAAGSDEGLAAGQRQVSAGFDRPPQEFAVLRAQRDAEDRAARELAELIRLAVAQDLARLDRH